MNELEERRVIRLLDGVADAVEPLPVHDVSDLLHTATLGVGARRRSRLRRPDLLATAAAAVLIVGTALATGVPGSPPRSSGQAGAPAVASFPEGSALHLLLSGSRVDRSS